MTTPLDFLYEFALARAEVIVEIPGGAVVRSPAYPAAHDHNAALVQRAAQPSAVVEAIEDAMVDLAYRRVEVAAAAASARLGDTLAAAGYQLSREVVMALQQLPPEPGTEVVPLGLDERIAVAAAGWAADQPDRPAEVPRQLGERIRSAIDAADCTFFAVRTPDGQVRARADLYIRGDIAQIEEVITDEDFRGRGLRERPRHHRGTPGGDADGVPGGRCRRRAAAAL